MIKIQNSGQEEEEDKFEDEDDDKDVLGEAGAGCDVHTSVNDSCPNIHLEPPRPDTATSGVVSSQNIADYSFSNPCSFCSISYLIVRISADLRTILGNIFTGKCVSHLSRMCAHFYLSRSRAKEGVLALILFLAQDLVSPVCVILVRFTWWCCDICPLEPWEITDQGNSVLITISVYVVIDTTKIENQSLTFVQIRA